MDINDLFSRHKDEVLEILVDYQNQRIRFYEKQVSLERLLKKDIAMFALRGVETPAELVENSFNALDSSSEETVMGSRMQAVLATISSDTLDAGDFITLREGTMWVCELKSQTNTVNSSSLPQELRALRVRMGEITSRVRSSNQEVKAAICIARDSKPVDEIRVYGSTAAQRRDSPDLEGFEYRYITGQKFWQWISGYESALSLLSPLAEIDGQHVKAARQAAISRLTIELENLLEQNGLPSNLDGVLKARNLLSR